MNPHPHNLVEIADTSDIQRAMAVLDTIPFKPEDVGELPTALRRVVNYLGEILTTRMKKKVGIQIKFSKTIHPSDNGQSYLEVIGGGAAKAKGINIIQLEFTTFANPDLLRKFGRGNPELFPALLKEIHQTWKTKTIPKIREVLFHELYHVLQTAKQSHKIYKQQMDAYQKATMPALKNLLFNIPDWKGYLSRHEEIGANAAAVADTLIQRGVKLDDIGKGKLTPLIAQVFRDQQKGGGNNLIKYFLELETPTKHKFLKQVYQHMARRLSKEDLKLQAESLVDNLIG